MAGKRAIGSPVVAGAAAAAAAALHCVQPSPKRNLRQTRSRKTVAILRSQHGDAVAEASVARPAGRKGSSRVSPTGKIDTTATEEDQHAGEWRSLGVSVAELSLPLTFVTGQNFRWRATGPSQFTGVVGFHLISLRQSSENGILFRIHSKCRKGGTSAVERELRDYLNLNTSLEKLYEEFAVVDLRFAAVAPYLVGARLLRQNPLECLFQFICSSNNHIQRISGMVEHLASRGSLIGTVQGIKFHAFPSLEELALFTEEGLREAGFGYRAKYIVGATEVLRSKDEGGEQWLMNLRNVSLEEAVKALCSLPGVGPKVAACIALFSLDQHHAIPVDTHVWQIAVRDLLPELAGKSLTLRLHQEVQDAFVRRFGKYAGWAHTVLFIAELSSQQSRLPKHLRLPPVQKVLKSKKKAVQPSVDEDEMEIDIILSQKRKARFEYRKKSLKVQK